MELNTEARTASEFKALEPQLRRRAQRRASVWAVILIFILVMFMVVPRLLGF